jgi:conjugative transfer region protein TrbK
VEAEDGTMEGKTLARIGAVVFVAVAFTMAAIELTGTEQPTNDVAARQVENAAVDPLRVELLRCQSLGEAAPRDAACLRAWAISRERFLKPAVKSATRQSDQLPQSTTIYKQPPPDTSTSQQDEVQ